MPSSCPRPAPLGLFARLAGNVAGNTAALIAAALIPLMAMVGSGIDMGRSYLAQARLQQACDSGVLAARKKLGSQVVATGVVPSSVADAGNKFFNLNFENGDYGTANRQFSMTLETDYSITGQASVSVPASVMKMFGFASVPIQVQCQAHLNFSNTDVMFVLDNTSSMNDTNPGDTVPKIQALRNVVKSFYTQLQGSKSPGTRIRFGFVPYSTNVNVGTLLKSDWVVDSWNYQGRLAKSTGNFQQVPTYNNTFTYVSGSATAISPYFTTTCPASTATWNTPTTSTDANGVTSGTTTVNGNAFSCSITPDGSGVLVNGTAYNNYVYNWTSQQTGTVNTEIYKWQYAPVTEDVSFLKNSNGNLPITTGQMDVPMYGYPSPTPASLTAYFRGCMEERGTYEIDDYTNVDLTRALDLDLDTVPTPGNPATQWRPMFNEISFEREIWWDGTGSFTQHPVTTDNDYMMAGWGGFSACPAPAQKLQEMAPADVDAYLATLNADGSTYHDIGMIWGGRLLSPTGLFAAENADVGGSPTSRNLIFLTDGLTAPLDLSYGAYGIEPLDQRRWNPTNPVGGLTLTQVVEKRFTFACNEVKKRNITVWVVSFGVSLNPILANCAGPGHAFSAANAAQLNTIFSNIAAQVGDLRISK